MKRRILVFVITMLLLSPNPSFGFQQPQKIKKTNLNLKKVKGQKKRNVIFILTDDHRYDFMGFTGKVPWLKTPNMDKMAAEGAHMKNAFVTTSLCSPSRASILTGEYSHVHTIVDNVAPNPESNVLSGVPSESRISNFLFWKMAYGRP
ncbi:sulfatase-like hydrolase/transferase [Zobellia laminariae]|uniref:sulfatase-like hydrolase/transferase n=1 Tax=Zobellia laminariae TaxID=248906 RepID=UPI0026F452ED|nr:sulfatase-like hydrolase/transferase [Zobellia laminariae]WKX76792.1 sulfatase-like hydrolase/transferase [Zobellia laminariae]